MKKLLAAILSLLPLSLAAQTELYSLEYGKVNLPEITEKTYSLDPDSEAVVIFENGDYRFLECQTGNKVGLHLYMTVSIKIKIYKEAGLDYAFMEIPYYTPSHEPESVTDIEGMTYNFEKGQVVITKLSQANIYTEKTENDYSVKKIAFPDVRAGSVIEFKYTIETPYFYNMRTWWFQKKIPVYHSKFAYRATPFYNCAFISRGLSEFDEQESETDPYMHTLGKFTYKETKYTYAMNRMPAFRDEEFLTNTVDDYMANINLQLSNSRSSKGNMTDIIDTWPDMCRNMLKDKEFGGYINAAKKEAQTILPTLGLEGKSELEKFQAISEYVKGTYSWNRYISKYAGTKLPVFLKEKTGSSAELNLFMIGLMKAAGLNVYPVGVSTTNNDLIYKDYPFSRFINNVVAMAVVDEENYFADASLSLTRYDELPYWCTSVEGLVIRRAAPQWVYIEENEPSLENKTLYMTVSPAEGKIKVVMKQELKGYQAYQNRNLYNGDIGKLKEKYKGYNGMNVSEMSVENFNRTEEPFVIKTKYDLTTGPAGTEPDKIHINPLLYMVPSENPFKQARRDHPLNLIHSEVNNYTVEIEIPEGYEVEYMPEEMKISNNVMQIVYAVSANGNKIKLNAGYALKWFYKASEYQNLKDMYENMVRTLSEAIILKKTE